MRARNFFSLAVVFAPAWAAACSFAGLSHDVQFAPASTRLESRELILLAEWFAVQRDPNRATGGVYRADVFARAIKGDAASSKKARRRLDEIAGLLTTLGTATSVEVHAHVDEVERPSIRNLASLDVVHASVQPACAKTRSCCKWSEGPPKQPSEQ
jgi:hypothetical protein